MQKLIAQLGSERAALRESAAARLTLLATRALDPLLGALKAGSRRMRREAVSVLEAVPSPRARAAILELVTDRDAEVARRAIEAAAGFPEPAATLALKRVLASSAPALREAAVWALGRLHRAGAVEALDALLGRLLDENEAEPVRLAALETLHDLPRRERAPLLERLRRSGSATLAASARETDEGARTLEDIHASVARTEDPRAIRGMLETLAQLRAPTSIPVLHALLQRLATRTAVTEAAAVAETRAAVHRALAVMGSRIALYDLREMLEARPPRALAPLLEAAAAIGDASLLPALATLAAEFPAQLEACARAFSIIVEREGVRRGSRAFKAVRPEHRSALDALWARARSRG